MLLIYAALTTPGSYAAVGGWDASANNPSVPRFRQKAVTLTDGRVLLVGGQAAGDGTQPASSACDLFDPNTGLFTATGSMSISRYEHAVVRLPDGRVLASGGVPSNTSALISCQTYTPATGTWVASAPLPVGTSGHEMVLLPNGKVLLAGGGNYIFGPVRPNCYIYDPAANSGTGGWAATGSMGVARMGFHLVLLDNGLVLAACGRTSSASFDGTVQAELYNPATGTWSPTGNMVLSRGAYSGPASTATKLQDGRVLITGGDSSAPGLGTMYSQTEIYNPATGTWSVGPAMPAPRELHEAILLNNGNVLVAGGRSTAGPAQQSIVLDTANMIWGSPRLMKESREVFSLSLLPDGKVLAPLGSPASMWTPHSTAEIYDPSVVTAVSDWNLLE